jgi:hypothetical protein
MKNNEADRIHDWLIHSFMATLFWAGLARSRGSMSTID